MCKFAQSRPAKKPKEEMFALHFMTQNTSYTLTFTKNVSCCFRKMPPDNYCAVAKLVRLHNPLLNKVQHPNQKTTPFLSQKFY